MVRATTVPRSTPGSTVFPRSPRMSPCCGPPATASIRGRFRRGKPSADPDLLEVAGQPARLFDFADLDPLEPGRLCDSEDTPALSAVPALAKLSELHADELLDAGYVADTARPERLGQLDDGFRSTPVMRKLLIEGVQRGELSQSPFTEAGRQALYEYFNQPAERGLGVGLTRLHHGDLGRPRGSAGRLSPPRRPGRSRLRGLAVRTWAPGGGAARHAPASGSAPTFTTTRSPTCTSASRCGA